MPPLPTILQGPAIVIFNGLAYYFKGGIKRSLKRSTFDVESDAAGFSDRRLKSTVVEISGTPAGQLTTDAAFGKMFPYAVTDIGKSVFGNADAPLVIHTKAGQTITYARAAITKLPGLRLKPTDTLFGDITFTCLGKGAVQPTTAGSFNAIAAAAFADTTFDGDSIKTARYRVAWGGAPYDAMGSKAGFEIDIAMDLQSVEVDDFGVVDMVLKSMVATAKFAPSSLTEDQVNTLLGIQDADVVLPGQSLTKANRDLVISSDVFSATLYKAGPVDGESTFGVGEHRHGDITWVSRRSWTAGAANPLWLFDVL